MRLVPIEQEALFGYLREQPAPVMEIELIRRFTPDEAQEGEDRLFGRHFSLYHALYLLKQYAGERGYFLHLDPMRIRMIRVPGGGLCRHYMPAEGTFCPMASPNGLFCPYHEAMYAGPEGRVCYDPLREFYSNPENIRFGSSRLLQRLMNGIVVYAFRRGEIEKALELFGIAHPGKRVIQKRYHELARRFHPDSCGGSEVMMKRLNNAYHVLREVYVL